MTNKTLQHWVIGMEVDDIVLSKDNERFLAGSKRYHELKDCTLKGAPTMYREPTSGRLVLMVYGVNH